MITPCTLVYPYFENRMMLEMQVANWNRYAGLLNKLARIIVVDDCSQTYPAQNYMRNMKIPAELWRVTERQPWHMHGARNIGAHVAGEDNPWLFLSDIDIMLTPEMAYTMLEKQLEPGVHYTMERTFAPDFRERKTHPNTFLVQKRVFWQINGYDEDFCGTYGGDGEFARQLRNISPHRHMEDVVLIGYGRRQRDGDPIVKDADTTSLDRAEFNKKYRAIFDAKRKTGDMRSQKPLRLPFERIPL